MARQRSILKVGGSLDGVTYYRTKDGNIAREKTGVSGERIASDPRFARTRENGREFGTAAKAGKLLRSALRSMMAHAADGRVTARMTQAMHSVLLCDANSERGSRNVADGLGSSEGRQLLETFNFNATTPLGTVLFKLYNVDAANGEISISDFSPANDLAAPAGADTVVLSAAWVDVDFEAGTWNTAFTNVVSRRIAPAKAAVSLSLGVTPAPTGNTVVVLKVEFAQTVNGKPYVLSNGAFNCLGIVKVL